MKIEITGSDYNELLSLLSQFPNGKVTANGSNAFWECSATQNANNLPKLPYANNPVVNQAPKQSDNPFLRAFDSMAQRF